MKQIHISLLIFGLILSGCAAKDPNPATDEYTIEKQTEHLEMPQEANSFVFETPTGNLIFFWSKDVSAEEVGIVNEMSERKNVLDQTVFNAKEAGFEKWKVRAEEVGGLLTKLKQGESELETGQKKLEDLNDKLEGADSKAKKLETELSEIKELEASLTKEIKAKEDAIAASTDESEIEGLKAELKKLQDDLKTANKNSNKTEKKLAAAEKSRDRAKRNVEKQQELNSEVQNFLTSEGPNAPEYLKELDSLKEKIQPYALEQTTRYNEFMRAYKSAAPYMKHLDKMSRLRFEVRDGVEAPIVRLKGFNSLFKVSEQESEEDELLDPSLENRVCDSSNNGITNAAYRADGGEMQFDVFTTECVKDGKKQSGAPESIFEFRLKRDAAAIGGAVVYKGTVTRVDTNSGERQEGVASFSAPAQTK